MVEQKLVGRRISGYGVYGDSGGEIVAVFVDHGKLQLVIDTGRELQQVEAHGRLLVPEYKHQTEPTTDLQTIIMRPAPADAWMDRLDELNKGRT